MELTPQQINDFIAKAVLDSAIGEAVKAAVDKVLSDLQKSYNNPFETVIKSHVTSMIDKVLATQFAPQIEAGVKAALDKSLTDEVLKSITAAAIERLRRNY